MKMTCVEDKVIAIGYSAYPLPDGKYYVFSDFSEEAHILSKEQFTILSLCNVPRTIMDHALHIELQREGLALLKSLHERMIRAFWPRLDPEHKLLLIHQDILDALEQFAEKSLLCSQESVLKRIAHSVGRRTEHTIANQKITYVGIPTCSRPDSLLRSMDSYMSNALKYGENPIWIVVDDSRDGHSIEKNRHVLQHLRSQYRSSILYTNRAKRRDYCLKLAKYSGIDARTIAFALLGSDSFPPSIGASRNSLLLVSNGALTMQCDDDTICRTIRPPGYRDGVRFHSRNDLSDYWFFRDESSMEDILKPISENIIRSHEALLGRSVAAYSSELVLNNVPVDLSDVDDHFLRRATSEQAFVGLSFLGAAGDPGSPVTIHRLLSSGDTLYRLLSGPQEYAVARNTRHILRCTNQNTLTSMPFCIPMNMGLDNRTYVPPFMPILRAEDAVFMHSHAKIYPNSLTALLPLAIWHLPPVQRHLNKDPFTIRRFNANIFLARIISELSLVSGNSPKERLYSLGQSLISVSTFKDFDFIRYIKDMWLSTNLTLVHHIYSRLSSLEEESCVFGVDLAKLLQNVEENLLCPDYFVPSDLMGRDNCEQISLKQLIHQYGLVVSMWPDIVDASRELSGKGHDMTSEIIV